MKYWTLFANSYSDGAILSCIPSDGPKSYKYKEAIFLKDQFPKVDDAVMCFDPNYDDRLVVYDIIDCLDNVLVFSEKAKNVFEESGVKDEFLHVKLWDHKNKVVSGDYFIFNCLKAIYFIDMEKSELAMDPTFPDEITRTEKLVVSDKIEEFPMVLCPSNMKGQVFISDEMKNNLESAGITGLKVFEADGWDGLDV